MKKAAAFIILAVLSISIISLAGCFPFGFDMTGTWSGTITNDLLSMTVSGSITITQDGDSLSGTGNFTGRDCFVNGTVSGSDFTLNLNFSGYSINASGNVSGDAATGTWTDAEGYYGSFELTRE